MITRRRAIFSGSSALGLVALGATLPVLSACNPASGVVGAVGAANAVSAAAPTFLAIVSNAVELATNVTSAFMVGDSLSKKLKAENEAKIQLVEAADEPEQAQVAAGSPVNPATPRAPTPAQAPAAAVQTASTPPQVIVVDHLLMPMSVNLASLTGRVRFDGKPTLPGRDTPLSAMWVAPVIWGVDQVPHFGDWMSVGAEEWGKPFGFNGTDKAFGEALSEPGFYRQGWAVMDFGETERVLGVGSILEMLTDDHWRSDEFQARQDLEDRPPEVEQQSYTIIAGNDEVLKVLSGA